MTAFVRMVLAAGVVMFIAPAGAQIPNGKDIFKGRLKPGLYENVVTSEMAGITGVPTEQTRSTETQKRCITAGEIDKGLDLRRDCTVKTFKESAGSVQIVSDCKDGSTNELRIATTPVGYTSELKHSGKQKDGKPFSMSMRTEGKYLGACKS